MKINLITDFDFYELGALENIIYDYELRDIVGIKFKFNKKYLLISVTDEDELELFIENNQTNVENRDPLNTNLMKLNASLISKNIFWVWELINQRGYSDGYQFEFSKSENEEKVTIQFIVIANNIKIYTIKKEVH